MSWEEGAGPDLGTETLGCHLYTAWQLRFYSLGGGVGGFFFF